MTRAVTSYSGSYRHTMDAKGRVSVPAEFRRAVGETFMMTRGHDECLYLYPMEEWELVEAELSQLRFTSSRARRYVRTMFEHARPVVVDSHGRVMVPQPLREFAELDGEVLVNGVLHHIEIWNPTTREKYDNESDESYEDISEDVWRHAKNGPGEEG